MAEVPAGKLVEAHGTFSTASCIRCHKSYDGEQIKVQFQEMSTHKQQIKRYLKIVLCCTHVVVIDHFAGIVSSTQ